jgi:predicted XRE-type DNA-binding protein
MENAIKTVIDKSKKNQKEICTLMNLKQSTISKRMNKEMKGTIEWAIDVAIETGVKSFTILKNGCLLSIKIKK